MRIALSYRIKHENTLYHVSLGLFTVYAAFGCQYLNLVGKLSSQEVALLLQFHSLMNGDIFHESSVRIPTPEQVFLEYPLAGLARRALATLLDSILIFAGELVLILISVLLISSFTALIGDGAVNGPDSWFIAFFIAYFVFMLVAPLFYYGIFEYYLNGQTPGKRAAGIRVIRANGLALDRTAAALRNLFRLIDLLPSSYLIGVWSVMLNSHQQRIGDLIAGTIVIALPKRQPKDSVTMGTAGYAAASTMLYEDKRGEEYRWLLDQFLRRRGEMDDSARNRIARMLAAKLGIPPTQAMILLEQQLYERFTSL
jgi:uncharacterized RDD family membrane protein YckC